MIAPVITSSGAVLLRSSLLAEAGVPHGFSTRRGGVSSVPFDSLNLGNPSDLDADRRDPPANIRENYRRILTGIGAADRELVEVHQVHGAGVHVIRRGGPSHPGLPEGTTTKADAIVTDDPGRALAVRVADCAPVLLASPDGRVVAAVHAGWRGVVAGVLPAAIAAMGLLSAAAPLAALGPCIGPEHFEVGPEVIEAFRAAFGTDAKGIVVRTDPATGKGFIDLKAALRAQLAAAGIDAVDVSDRCTHRDAGEFFSHRRDRGLTGRMAAVIAPLA